MTIKHTVEFEGWRPEIVVLCGSSRFKEQFKAEQARLDLEGKIVLSMGFFHHSDGVPEQAEDSNEKEDGAWKTNVDDLYLRKIDLADRVHVINPDGYIGESTQNEIEYAREHNVPITWLEKPDSHESIQ